MAEAAVTAFRDGSVEGLLHSPNEPNGVAVVLTHGAGSDCRAPLMIAVATQLCSAGYTILRTDLHFRRVRPKGPPMPATAGADRQGLEQAARSLGRATGFPVVLAGHSYGGRQSSMLAAEKPDLAAGLLLLSYPLHPPGKPEQLRTSHFPNLRTPCLFVHGETDPFATLDELRRHAAAIPAVVETIAVPKAGHDLNRGRLPWTDVLGGLSRLVARAT
jgi:predicted alpha/beta-hydrolase family hydrolase